MKGSMLTDDDVKSLEWWWCANTGLPIEVCDCEDCARARRRDAQAIQSQACGNCGAYRTVSGCIIEKCLNCGDDEIDLSMPIEVP